MDAIGDAIIIVVSTIIFVAGVAMGLQYVQSIDMSVAALIASDRETNSIHSGAILSEDIGALNTNYTGGAVIRTVMESKTDVRVNGVYFPKGTHMTGINISSINRNKNYTIKYVINTSNRSITTIVFTEAT